MKTFLIVKLDTPCTLDKSVMHVPAAEPLNFALSLCEASADETVRVVMLGLEQTVMEVGDHTIEVIPYYGQPSKLKEYLEEDTQIIIWQGRNVVDINTDRPASQLDSIPMLTKPRFSAYFEKLNFLKLWQVSMYNLLCSSYVKDLEMFCIITDVRLPLVDLYKVDKTVVNGPLPKGIKLVTQCHKHDDYMAYHNQHGNGIPWLETDIREYLYMFKSSCYMPLHSLPIWSHVDARKRNQDRAFGKYSRTTHSICQIQSLKYLDEYRIEQLQELVRRCDGDVVLMGRLGHDEKAIIRQKFPQWADKMLEIAEGASDEPLAFHFAAEQLLRFKSSLVITDGRYSRFGLMPNRLIEAIATHTIPVVHPMVYKNTDALSTEIITQLETVVKTVGQISDGTYDSLVTMLRRQLYCSYHETFGIKVSEQNIKELSITEVALVTGTSTKTDIGR
jgi:hypothetical protein